MQRWVRLPVFHPASGEVVFVNAREVSRSISASTGAVSVAYHNGIVATLLPSGAVMHSTASTPVAAVPAAGASSDNNNSNTGDAAPESASPGRQQQHHGGGHGNHQQAAPAGAAPNAAHRGSRDHTHAAETHNTNNASSSLSQYMYPSSSDSFEQNQQQQLRNDIVITTDGGHRLMRKGTAPVISLGSRALSTRITNPDQLPVGVEWREVREDGVVKSRLLDGRTLVEHADGTQFWVDAAKSTSTMTIECWPAEPIDVSAQRDTFADPSSYVSAGPFASPIRVDCSRGSLAFVCVRGGDLFVEAQRQKAIMMSWRPTGQTFNVDLENRLAHFRAATTNTTTEAAADKNSLRFVFDLVHGGLRGVDSLPDACPDGPSGLADALALHVSPYGRTRIRKLVEDTPPALDLDVTKPRQIIEQFALKNEALHPPGIILPDSRVALHLVVGPPPSESGGDDKLARSIPLSAVVPESDCGFAVEERAKELRKQLQQLFLEAQKQPSSSSFSSSQQANNNNNSVTSPTDGGRQARLRLRPSDPFIFFVLPDGRALEFLRPHEMSHHFSNANQCSDVVYSNVYAHQQEAVLCSVAPVTPSAKLAASAAALTRPCLSITAAPSTHVSCSDGSRSSASRCGNGPARSVADFLQRVHTFAATNPVAHGNRSSMLHAPSSVDKIVVRGDSAAAHRTVVCTRVYSKLAAPMTTEATEVALPGCCDFGQFRSALNGAVKSLHFSAPPLSWLERGGGNSAADGTTDDAAVFRPADGKVDPLAPGATKNRFTNQVAQRKAALAGALGDVESPRYFNPASTDGAALIQKMRHELESGDWKRLADPTKKSDRGTRGAGFAHFAAAAGKLLEQQTGGAATSGFSVSNNSQQQHHQNQSVDSNASTRGHIHARLVLDPGYVEFAPLHRGMRYQTAVNLINVGSNASRFRVKVALRNDDGTSGSGVPQWLRAEVPHIRLGPGMRAPIVLEVTGTQPVGDAFVDIVASFEGPHRNTLTSTATVRIATAPEETSVASTAQADVCWMVTTGNTVECLGPSATQFMPNSIRRVPRDATEEGGRDDSDDE